MRVQALTVIAKVIPGHEDELRAVLLEIGSHPDTNPYVRLSESPRTHLANWVVISDRDNGPRLFFASNHDGDRSSYLQELVSASPGLGQVFGHCEGYRGLREFDRFVSTHSYKSQTFFAGFPYETVETTRGKIAIRDEVEQLVDRLPGADGDAPRWQALTAQAEDLERRSPAGAMRGPVRAWLHKTFFAVLLSVARRYSRLRVNEHFVGVAANLDQPTVPPGLTDADHMTNLIDVKRGYRLILRGSLAFMQFLARHAFPPGDLAGVTTIRFARWVLIDGGRRLLFQSRFDGTWENYMGDFVDKIDWGLNAIWSNTVDYPTAGMQDIAAFKRFIRERQFEHLAVYEANPAETVLNMMRNRAITTGLSATRDDSVQDCLRAI